MFYIDNPVKQEALNFSALMNVLDCTEKKLEPSFETFAMHHSYNTPMDFDLYSDYFHVDSSFLKDSYTNAYHAFRRLEERDEIIKRGSLAYSSLLIRTAEAPRFLYLRGNTSLLQENRAVALIGSREASEKGKENTRRLVRELSKNGIVIISGLAKGIDVTAHKETLKDGFNTIAVIGTNLNQYYPSENREVQKEIEKKGLVVSQFSPATKTERWFFPVRNGVMSGLSLATVIMEAGETSGALKQADFALKQDRQVIIPRSVLDNPKIDWPKKYVKRGAQVANTPADVLRILATNPIFKTLRQEDSSDTGEDFILDEMLIDN